MVKRKRWVGRVKINVYEFVSGEHSAYPACFLALSVYQQSPSTSARPASIPLLPPPNIPASRPPQVGESLLSLAFVARFTSRINRSIRFVPLR